MLMTQKGILLALLLAELGIFLGTEQIVEWTLLSDRNGSFQPAQLRVTMFAWTPLQHSFEMGMGWCQLPEMIRQTCLTSLLMHDESQMINSMTFWSVLL